MWLNHYTSTNKICLKYTGICLFSFWYNINEQLSFLSVKQKLNRSKIYLNVWGMRILGLVNSPVQWRWWEIAQEPNQWDITVIYGKTKSGIIQKNKLVFIPGTQNQAESLNVKFLHIMHTKNRGHIFEIRKKHIIEMIK